MLLADFHYVTKRFLVVEWEFPFLDCCDSVGQPRITIDHNGPRSRWIDYGGGVHNLSFSTTTNRITTSGYSYDTAGNLTNDGNHTYIYDAENKISKVDNVSAYVYDGEGHRAKKLVGENTRFVYGIGGELVAEFDGGTGALI